MKIECIVVGDLQENCYIITKDNNTIIVDPGSEFEKIDKKIKNLNAILITHYHDDHIGALKQLKEKYNVKIIDYKDVNEEFDINNFNFKVIDTKGHTNDSVSFYFKKEKIMFTGDFLFKETIGRTDFFNSNKQDMQRSINNIKKYKENIIIYPGHGEKTNLDYEKQNNIFLA